VFARHPEFSELSARAVWEGAVIPQTDAVPLSDVCHRPDSKPVVCDGLHHVTGDVLWLEFWFQHVLHEPSRTMVHLWWHAGRTLAPASRHDGVCGHISATSNVAHSTLRWHRFLCCPLQNNASVQGARFSRRAVHHCFLSWSGWKSL